MRSDQSQHIKLTLKPPARFDYTRGDKPKSGWNFTTHDAKTKYVTFDDQLVAAFEARACAGVEHEYVVRPDPGGRPPMIQEIVGIYSSRKGGGDRGGRPGAPMLTDRQAALFAAAKPGVITAKNAIADAERFYAWLVGGGKQEASTSPAARVAATSVMTPPADSLLDEFKREALERLRESIVWRFPKAEQQQAWVNAFCARLNIADVADADLFNIDAGIAELYASRSKAAAE